MKWIFQWSLSTAPFIASMDKSMHKIHPYILHLWVDYFIEACQLLVGSHKFITMLRVDEDQ